MRQILRSMPGLTISHFAATVISIHAKMVKPEALPELGISLTEFYIRYGSTFDERGGP
jgi:hypothetical protein